MKNLMVKGLTIVMIMATMVSGLAFADATLEDGGQPTDKMLEIREQLEGKFQEKLDNRKDAFEAFKNMTDEEKIEALEEKLDNEDLDADVVERIEAHIASIEERIIFSDMLDELLADKTEDEKVEALEDLLATEDFEGKQADHITRLIERYTIGEAVLEEIKAALEGVAREDRLSVVEELIESGDYDELALERLEDMQERMIENEEIRSLLEGLEGEERTAKIQELIDSGDYSDKTVEGLQKQLDRKEKMGELRSQLKEEFKGKFENWKEGRKDKASE